MKKRFPGGQGVKVGLMGLGIWSVGGPLYPDNRINSQMSSRILFDVIHTASDLGIFEIEVSDSARN